MSLKNRGNLAGQEIILTPQERAAKKIGIALAKMVNLSFWANLFIFDMDRFIVTILKDSSLATAQVVLVDYPEVLNFKIVILSRGTEWEPCAALVVFKENPKSKTLWNMKAINLNPHFFEGDWQFKVLPTPESVTKS